MTKETFLECVNNVDEDLIEAVPEAKKRQPIFKYSAVAAGIMLVVLASVVASKTVEKEPTAESKVAASQNILETQHQEIRAVTEGMAFNYCNNVYRVAKEEEFLIMNSLPTAVSWNEVGEPLAQNVVDVTGNNILGDIYAYKNSGDLSTLVLKQLNGDLTLAVEEEIYE